MRVLIILLSIVAGAAILFVVLQEILQGLKVVSIEKQTGLDVTFTLPQFERARVLLSLPDPLEEETVVQFVMSNANGNELLSESISLSNKSEHFSSSSAGRRLYILANLTEIEGNLFFAGETYHVRVIGEASAIREAEIWIIYGHNYGQSLLNEIRRQIKLREHPNAQVP